MYHHILVPLDGSLRAEHALPVAARIAQASKGTVILVRALGTSGTCKDESDAGLTLFQMKRQAEREEARQYLNSIASSPALADLPVIVSLPRGSWRDCLQTTITIYGADFLVCCDQMEYPTPLAWAGSFAEQLSRWLPIPFLCVPAHGPLNGSLAEKRRPITCLVAFAGSQPEHSFLTTAAALLAAFAGQHPGHLHCVPLPALVHSLGIPSATQQVTTTASTHLSGSQRAASLQQTRATNTLENQHDLSRADVIVLAMPFAPDNEEALLATRALPRVFVPSHQTGESKHLSQA